MGQDIWILLELQRQSEVFQRFGHRQDWRRQGNRQTVDIEVRIKSKVVVKQISLFPFIHNHSNLSSSMQIFEARACRQGCTRFLVHSKGLSGRDNKKETFFALLQRPTTAFLYVPIVDKCLVSRESEQPRSQRGETSCSYC